MSSYIFPSGPKFNKFDLDRNKEIVQEIYDNDYQFPPPPSKPSLTIVPGDSKITLYWDRIAETTMDPVLLEYDFQGYKIYKASDPNFNDGKFFLSCDPVGWLDSIV